MYTMRWSHQELVDCPEHEYNEVLNIIERAERARRGG